jgi:hypothetical protein
MSSSAAATVLASRLPPEESFWQRHSPHQEMPLSTGASVALHGLCIGGLFLLSILMGRLIGEPSLKMPVETVRLIDLPGGDTEGPGSGKEGPGGALAENFGEAGPPDQAGEPDAPPQIALSRVERTNLHEQFVPDHARLLQQNENKNRLAFVRLAAALRDKGRPRDGHAPGPGAGGPGAGPGKGPGKGSKATLTQREKRMLRWNMRFPAGSPREYIQQLNKLGAYLAIPLDEGGSPQYKVIRDLKARPAQLLDEDVGKLNRIYWIDDNPRSVAEVMRELGVSGRPNRFVAFMPKALEDDLYEMEKKHWNARLAGRHGPFNEEKIFETKFIVEPARGYKVGLVTMTLKAPGQR